MKVGKFLTGALAPSILLFFSDGCINGGEFIPTDCSGSDLDIVVSEFSNTTTCQSEDGSVTVVASGGAEPYLFSLDGSKFQSASVFNELPLGAHVIIVKDRNGCEKEVIKELTTPDAPVPTFATVQNTRCLPPYNGSISITNTSGGSGPYQFKIGDGAYGSAVSFEELKHGDYEITIEDNSGCTVPFIVTIDRGETGITYEGEVKAIFESKCLLSGCHLNNDNGQGDWGIYSQAFQKRDLIKSKTQDGSMPIGGTLSADQKATIACWVDDGAPEN